MGRVVILSDIHLSPTHGFFWENWCLARDFANRAAADAVIVNGDLTINGPDSDEEVKFAALATKSLRGPVLPSPGNHESATNRLAKTRTRLSILSGLLDGTVFSAPIAGCWT
jgi:3',5'-cyclic AMP phosphodiesterase CpdA